MHTDNVMGFERDPYNSNDVITDQIIIRRCLVRVQYSAENAKFVVQTLFHNSGVSVVDAYLDVTDPWTNIFTLRLGLFYRPIFEAEYAANKMESMEHSEISRVLYPGLRDLGLMLIIAPKDLFTINLAAFNNTYQSAFKQFYPNHRQFPLYFIGRIRKSFLIKDADLAFDLGVYTRQGQMAANTTNVIDPENNASTVSNSVNIGDGISRSWYGAEAQVYWNFFGGVKVLAEYVFGSNADQMSTDGSEPIRLRDFSGYYVYFIKNLGTEWQAVVKYDVYDPNTKINDDLIISASDLTKSTLGLGIHNYSFDNLKFSLWYDIIKLQQTKTFSRVPINNLLTARIQFSF